MNPPDLKRDMTPDGDLDDEIPENELEAEPNHEDHTREGSE